MNIQPLNYCRQFRLFAAKHYHPNFDLNTYADKCKRAVKFLLPKGGFGTFDPELKGFQEGEKWRLPFSLCAFEFEQVDTDTGKIIRNIILAEEIMSGDKLVEIRLIFLLGIYETWYPLPQIAIGPEFRTVAALSEIDNLMHRQIFIRPVEEVPKELAGLFNYRVVTLTQTLNALSCVNVTHTIPPELRGNSVSKSSLPFDSYRILVLAKSNTSSSECTPMGYDRHSPREHLRRGHIRRYENGTKTWVNAHTVSRGTEGKILKDYAIK